MSKHVVLVLAVMLACGCGARKTLRALGESCQTADQCASGLCADGVCSATTTIDVKLQAVVLPTEIVYPTGQPLQLFGDWSSVATESVSTLTYRWKLVTPAGSTAKIAEPNVANPVIVLDVPGLYSATLIVSDGIGESAPSAMTITAVAPSDPGVYPIAALWPKLDETFEAVFRGREELTAIAVSGASFVLPSGDQVLNLVGTSWLTFPTGVVGRDFSRGVLLHTSVNFFGDLVLDPPLAVFPVSLKLGTEISQFAKAVVLDNGQSAYWRFESGYKLTQVLPSCTVGIGSADEMTFQNCLELAIYNRVKPPLKEALTSNLRMWVVDGYGPVRMEILRDPGPSETLELVYLRNAETTLGSKPPSSVELSTLSAPDAPVVDGLDDDWKAIAPFWSDLRSDVPNGEPDLASLKFATNGSDLLGQLAFYGSPPTSGSITLNLNTEPGTPLAITLTAGGSGYTVELTTRGSDPSGPTVLAQGTSASSDGAIEFSVPLVTELSQLLTSGAIVTLEGLTDTCNPPAKLVLK